MGAQIRARRKELGVSATVVAEAAGMSRITLYRIEKGELSVTLGAYLNALDALGMSVSLKEHDQPEAGDNSPDAKSWIPVRIRLADYPVLKRLAWHVHVDELSPVEAWSIYQSNWRHAESMGMSESETELVEALRAGLSSGEKGV
ncbi:helix-turn-helix domain-containing protein [Halopseudomonas phragmitis]|nr:helix-turn-helix domain-containing protein [Halopseudomonas phragmitis]